jgi:hypothetical protein
MLGQFAVRSLSFTFLRNNISCGQAAQVSTDNKMCLPCPCMRYPLPLERPMKVIVFNHNFLFASNFTGSFLHF